MLNQKHSIMRRNGAPVIITSLDGGITETIAIIGRASKQFNSTLALEHYRRAHFLPNIDIKSGYLCYSIPANETYILVATYPDLIAGKICTNVSHMMICNSEISTKGDEMVADGRGNLKKVPIDKVSNLSVHAQLITQDLRMYDPGLHPDSKYLIYAPGVSISVLDKLKLRVLEWEESFKVVAVDYISFPGCALIQVTSETRV